MSLKDDLAAEVKATFAGAWEEQGTLSVPAPEELRLNANHAKSLETATVLYANLAGSTNLVEQYQWQFGAEIHSTYFRCAARLIRSEGGVVAAYDGDRMMAVFAGDSRNTVAVRAAMKIHFAVMDIIRPALIAQYQETTFALNHVVGVDTGAIRAVRIGVRGDDDLVWIGPAARHAAMLTALVDRPIWITRAVYDTLNADLRFTRAKPMWEKRLWTPMNNAEIYGSTYWWRIA